MEKAKYTKHFFISPEEALSIIQENIDKPISEMTKLTSAIGSVLSENVFSPIDFPSFNQSNFDGYAICYDEFIERKELKINPEIIQAGDSYNYNHKPYCAYKIFTGAPIPIGSDTILLVEHTQFTQNKITSYSAKLVKHQGFRTKGSSLKEKEIVLRKGSELTPYSVSLLSSLGIKKCLCFQKPKVALIVTGNELVQVGKKLNKGEVYDSNSVFLKLIMKQNHNIKLSVFYSKDIKDELSKKVKNSLTEYDILLLSGGVSMGDYDFSLHALLENEVNILFHKIKQKPGKPLLVGKKNKKWVIGLPGNPSSVMVSYEIYLKSLIHSLVGKMNKNVNMKAKLTSRIENKSELTLFLKGHYVQPKVMLLDGQESYKLEAFSKANCFVKIEKQSNAIETNEVSIFPF